MEDQDLILSPLGPGLENVSLFAVFDGHVDKNCAIAAKKILPEV